MQYRRYQIALTLIALVGLGCESGRRTVLTIDVTAGVASAYSGGQPGLLAANVEEGGFAAPVAPLCGQAIDEPLTLDYDHGFGCLGDRDGKEVLLNAWVQPVSTNWDLTTFCALEQRSGRYPLDIGPEVWGETEDAGGDWEPHLSGPESGWPRGEGKAKWGRDFSPCGGNLQGEITVDN